MGKIIKIKVMAKQLRRLFYDNQEMTTLSSAVLICIDSRKLSLGYTDDVCYSCWSVDAPAKLITCWRTVQLLNKLDFKANSMIIRDCYYAVDRESQSKDALERLAKYVPDIVDQCNELLQVKIDDVELEQMLSICNSPDNNIELDISELDTEIKLGTINLSPGISQAYSKTTAYQNKRHQCITTSKIPLNRINSFGWFCTQLHIDNLCTDRESVYRQEWEHIDAADIDQQIIYIGLFEQTGLDIWCSEYTGSGNGNFGRVGHPIIQLADESLVEIREAKFIDRKIMLTTQQLDHMFTKQQCLASFWEKNPRFVGISIKPFDSISEQDKRLGYYAISKASEKRYRFPKFFKH